MRRLVWLFVLLSINAAAESRFTPYADYLYRIWSVESGLPQISVQAIVQDADGFIWLGTQNGLARFDGQQFEVFNTANTPLLPSNLISSLLGRVDVCWLFLQLGGWYLYKAELVMCSYST